MDFQRGQNETQFYYDPDKGSLIRRQEHENRQICFNYYNNYVDHGVCLPATIIFHQQKEKSPCLLLC